MKKYFLLLFIAAVSLSSCIKGGNDPYKDAQDQLVKDEVIIKKFIADNNIPAVRHESGVYYQIIEPGSGNYNYTTNSPTITAKYAGRFLSGNSFDSSNAATIPLSNVISGWKIGIPLIQKGGKIRLIIPSGYAYGPNANGKIPGNSILDFDIELLDVK
nr:FKBP-type peptidyl-prolyl cis-trans isomerase [Pseudopedobacter sp.]